ncbi:MAG: RNA polymerase factor sigma-54 [Alphaproteobacteria bacterium]|nr:RNA polymerase factor sigma-54 [Alphaproteobacteria bacterium]
MSKLTQNLDLRQSQNLVMTPQLQQAIKLLQLNNIELAEYIETELEENPLLEKAEQQNEETGDQSAETPPEKDSDNNGDEVSEAFDQTYEASDDFDSGKAVIGPGGGGFEEMDESFENRMTTEKTLREHLQEQLFMAVDDKVERSIGLLMIDQLDEAGYLRADIKSLADNLACPPARIEKMLRLMKKFDPAGVFAADLAECLALQLEERGALDQPMRMLLQHLPLLAQHDFKKLAQLCDVNETYLRDMVAEIKALNPKPAALFDHLVVQTAVPDVLMRRLPKTQGGGWRVELNNETLPRVLINQSYYTEVLSHAASKKDKEFLASKLNAANWLMRALDQRAQTILKVGAAIVEQQDAFFNYGIEFLRPMKLKDIAEIIDMHESTVSRVTTGKFIGTPRGIFELKFFFSVALESADGTSHSAESVKARIKALIDSEDPKSILSDDEIVDLLKKEGMELARRTVAKYREGMNIGSSVQRRRQKRS